MADASVRRRGHGEDAIYFAADKNRYIGAVSVGFGAGGKRVRRKVSGKTKQEVRDKLKALHAELDAGVQSPAGYTVQAAMDAWLEHGLSGRSARTVQLYRDGVKPLMERLGAAPLRKLTAADVRSALAGLSGHLSTRSMQIAHNCLVRAIRHAETDNLVGRNVAALVRPPTGQDGRPSKALTLDQARALIDAAAGRRGGGADAGPYRLHAYVVLLLMTGIRPEEARALRWDHVDLDAGTVAIWRSDRAGGDTKTARSRRTLKLPEIALERAAGAQGGPGGGPAQGGGVVAGQRPGVHHHDRDDAGPAQHQARVPADHEGCGPGGGLGSPRAAAHVREHHVGGRRAGRGDRPGGRAQADQHDRTGLPARTASRHHHGCRGNG